MATASGRDFILDKINGKFVIVSRDSGRVVFTLSQVDAQVDLSANAAAQCIVHFLIRKDDA